MITEKEEKENIPKIIITSGEPAGIGPDILIKLAQHKFNAQIIALANRELLEQRAKRLKLPLKLMDFDQKASTVKHQPESLYIQNIKLAELPDPGTPTNSSADYILESLDQAVDHCLNNRVDAMVTNPINKHIVNHHHTYNNLKNFHGHTEYLAEKSNSDHVVMMLVVEQPKSLPKPLRVALATTHIPLSEVSSTITSNSLQKTIKTLHRDLATKYNIKNPNILVCGLNPHAGEQGDLGKEEIEIINPCLKRLREQGLQVSDALPADTLFTAHHLKKADAVLAMYHDQGLAPLKSHGFGKAVNLTLGLPFIRTSVDHGTAFDLAGTGLAEHTSLIEAVNLAIRLSNNHN